MPDNRDCKKNDTSCTNDASGNQIPRDARFNSENQNRKTKNQENGRNSKKKDAGHRANVFFFGDACCILRYFFHALVPILHTTLLNFWEKRVIQLKYQKPSGEIHRFEAVQNERWRTIYIGLLQDAQ